MVHYGVLISNNGIGAHLDTGSLIGYGFGLTLAECQSNAMRSTIWGGKFQPEIPAENVAIELQRQDGILIIPKLFKKNE